MKQLESFLTSFNSNPWVTALTILIGVVGFVWGFYSYFKSKRFKSLTHHVQNFNLINDKLKMVEGLDITFKERRVDSLSVAEFTIWNNGNETINGSDIARKEKLYIRTINDASILDYKIIHTPKSANDISVTAVYDITEGESVINALNVDFDYLDPKDGVSVQVYHTGTTFIDLRLYGTIKGMKEIDRYVELATYRSSGTKFDIHRKRSLRVLTYMFLSVIVMFAFMFYDMYMRYSKSGFTGFEVFKFIFFLSGSVLVMIILFSDIIGINSDRPPKWTMKDTIFK